MATLKLRDDLVAAESTSDDGNLFFDITDPRSGNSLRLYDHEWQLARRLDGAKSYAEVAGWARESKALGFEPSAADVAGYAKALAGLGFFDEPDSVAALPLSNGAGAAAGGDETSFAELNSVRQPGANAAAASDDKALPVSSANTTVPGAPAPAVLAELRAAAAPPAPAGETAADLLRAPAAGIPTVSASPTAKTAIGPAPSVPAASAPRPVASTPAAAAKPATPPAKSSSGVLGAIIFAILVVALAAGYLLFVAPNFAPAHVKVRTVAPARDVIRFADSRGTVHQAAPVVLSFGVEGKVSDVVAAGAAVTPGKTLASLATYAELEKNLADVRDRETFYENALKAALAKNKAATAKVAGAKVKEKKELREQLEARIQKARIVATSTGTVSEVTAAVGGMVAAGAPVLKVVDKRLMADVKFVPADSALFAVGASVTATTPDGKQNVPAHVLSVEGDVAHLQLDDGAALADGAEITFVKSRVPHVTPLPVEAVVKTQGGADQVWVLAGDVVQARPVTVVERTATEVLVSAGVLSPTDRVVLSPQPELKDGQKATTAP